MDLACRLVDQLESPAYVAGFGPREIRKEKIKKMGTKGDYVAEVAALADEDAHVLDVLPDVDDVGGGQRRARLGVGHQFQADHQALAAHVAHHAGELVAQFGQLAQKVRAHHQAVGLRPVFFHGLKQTNKKKTIRIDAAANTSKKGHFTSRTAMPTADATGLPPNVLKWRAAAMVLATAGVVTTAAIG